MLEAPLAALLLAVPAATEPPIGKWISDWGDNQCSLVRMADDSSALAIQITPGTAYASVTGLSPALAAFQPGSGESVALLLRPGGERINGQAMPTERKFGRGLSLQLDHSVLDKIAAASSVEFSYQGKTLFQAQLPNMGQAVKALRACEATLLKDWGIDPSERAALQRIPEPIGSTASWVRNDDYPVEALRAGASGTVVARVDVAADGKVDRCTVVAGDRVSPLDRKTCQVVEERGRFTPAIGPQGQAVAAPYVVKITWRVG